MAKRGKDIMNLKGKIVTTFFVTLITLVNAQTPGELITSYLPVVPQTYINPDGNSWVTSSSGAYVTDDQTESEISWVGIPQVDSEPNGDLNVGGSCGTTDIMDDPASGADASYVYFSDADGIPNSGDEYIFYRLRIAKDPGSGNFGFSVLIDIDDKFGTEDTDSVEGNPGFEMEIRVVNGGGSKGVYLDSVNATTSGVTKASYNLNVYTQRSYALSQNASCSSKPAVFYDFMVPFSDIETHFGISNSDPMRLVGATSINGASVLGTTASDIAGINDDNYANSVAGQDQAFSTFIKGQSGSSATESTGFGILPVELIAFDGEKMEGYNEINWTTGMELNNDYFEVQKSLNGKDFKTIGEVNGNGSSETEIDYVYYDMHPNESSYYRLKQVDFDGSTEYSKTIYVGATYADRISMNIKENGKYINVNPSNSTATIVITDMRGAVVINETINTMSSIDYSWLSSGFYAVTVQNSNEKISKKFIVK